MKDKMNSADDHQIPLYSSRITNIYLEYLARHYPRIDLDELLHRSHMNRYEVEDPGHWFTQKQVDSFHASIVEMTGDPHISREAGRFTSSAISVGAVRQYGLGLMSPLSVYLMVAHFYRLMTKGASATAKKLGPNKVEITVVPESSTSEKPYQCENRIGTFESLAKAFTGKYARVKEIECFHRGNGRCRYIISWMSTPALKWRRLRNLSILVSALISPVWLLLLTPVWWAFCFVSTLALVMLIGFRAEYLEKMELAGTIENQGNAAKELVTEINTRHSRAMLVQEIGQVTSNIIHIDRLINGAIEVIQQHLDYDRGMIFLIDPQNRMLRYQDGFGFRAETRNFVRGAVFPLNPEDTDDVVVNVFKKQNPCMINDMEAGRNKSARGLGFFRRIGSAAFVCTPIVYEKKSLGVMLLDYKSVGRGLTQSDVSLVLGLAAHIAVGVNNARFLERLKESEQALQRSRDELEVRVEKRTAELASAINDLNVEINERQRTESQMLATIREKDILIKEVHHRVKNNLQIVASLLDMSRRRARHPETVDSLAEAHAKIFTMSLIHTQLYQSDRFDEINMDRYLQNLISHLTQLYSHDTPVRTVIDAAGMFLSVTQAIPCALALNELISNALKYAFNGHKDGLISIRMQKKAPDGFVRVSVQDNGCGIPDSLDIENTDTLGFKLVRNLILKQLKGRMEVQNRHGTQIDIEFAETAG